MQTLSAEASRSPVRRRPQCLSPGPGCPAAAPPPSPRRTGARVRPGACPRRCHAPELLPSPCAHAPGGRTGWPARSAEPARGAPARAARRAGGKLLRARGRRSAQDRRGEVRGPGPPGPRFSRRCPHPGTSWLGATLPARLGPRPRPGRGAARPPTSRGARASPPTVRAAREALGARPRSATCEPGVRAAPSPLGVRCRWGSPGEPSFEANRPLRLLV